MSNDVVIAVISSIPACVLAAASWRAARKANANGSIGEIKESLWYMTEKTDKIHWFLTEHVNDHAPYPRRGR